MPDCLGGAEQGSPPEQIPEWDELQLAVTPGQPHTQGEDLPWAGGGLLVLARSLESAEAWRVCCVPGGHPPRRLSPLLVAADLRRLVRPIQSPVGRSEGDQPWLCAPHLGMTLQQNGTDTWPSHLMSESQPTGPEPSDPPPSLLEARSLQGKGLRDPLYRSHHFQECGPEVCVVRWG